jgi:hypothetical protein
VSAGRFLGFIVHEQGIQVDPKKVESINKMEEPTCKRDVQKLLGKINYLRRFIANLVGKIDPFLPLLKLKCEDKFIWGAEQREALERIKDYLTAPPVLRAPQYGKEFRVYVIAQECVISAVLVQEERGREFIIAFVSRRLLDAETLYVFLEKLCLLLYFAGSTFSHYVLTSQCTIVC